ncbi:MAG: AAA family ATPase [Gammaproteobacteria bacterium]
MSNDQGDLEAIIKSRFPIITIETHEEARVVDLFKRLALPNDWPLFVWNVVDGLVRVDQWNERVASTYDLDKALRHINQSPQNGVFLFLDIHPFLDEPVHVRLLKNMAQDSHKARRTMVLIGHSLVVPAELQRMAARFDLTMPSASEMRDILKEEIQVWEVSQREKLRGSSRAANLMVRHLVGLCEEDARRLMRHAIRHDGAITMDDIERICRKKYEMLNQEGLLSLELDTCDADELGGLNALKHWLQLRKAIFAGGGEDAGLDAPKGLMLLGVQGCGKSLAAKCIAGTWRLPLLRLDFGVLYNKYFGETERNLRQALQAADAMSPCVLWIDEIEKGVSTDGGGSMDGGVSRRVLGTFLTWMAERKSRVFIIATANEIKALPPELMRKGRFDEIFFVDLPDAQTREEIFRIHLTRRKLAPDEFDLEAMATVARGFSGSEIEQAIVAALYHAYNNKSPLATVDVLGELERTRPLSVVMAEKVTELRRWAQERAVAAH